MADVVERWFGPDAGDRYRLALMLLLAVLGTPPVVHEVLTRVDRLSVGLLLALGALAVAVVAVGSRGRLQSWMPAVAAAYLALLVWATGGLASTLGVAFLLIALASAFLHEPRWFALNLAWTAAVATLPVLYDATAVSAQEYRAGRIEGTVMLAAVVVVHVLSHVLRARNRRLRAVLRDQRMTIARLQEAQDAKDLFLSALSHELRTPLTSIMGISHTIQEHDHRLAADRRRDLVGRLVANSERLERLLSDLLDLRRLQEGATDLELTVVHLPDLVDSALGDVDTGGRTIHVDVPAGVVNADRSKVERILVNLVANACKHTPVGTTVWIRAEAAQGSLTILVDDDGPGVADELKTSVFEAFQQGPQSRDDPSPGTGVGLSIVAQFARLHGGRAWVEDRPGGGAAFRVQVTAHTTRRTRRSTTGLVHDPLHVAGCHASR